MLGINGEAVAGLIIESTATHAAPVGVGPKMKDLGYYSILQSISASDVKRDPFPHVVIDQCLPDHLYAELARTYPADETILAIGGNGGSKRPRQNSRCDIGAHRILSNPDIFSQSWLNFAAYHTSPQFLAQVVALLGADIRSIYPALDARLGRALESWTSEIRYAPGWRQSDIALDCHIGINTPTTRRSSVRPVHTDAPDELFAALFYFRRDEDSATGGDLEICRWRSDHDHFLLDQRLMKSMPILCQRYLIYQTLR